MTSCLLNMIAAMGVVSSSAVDVNELSCKNHDKLWIHCEIELVECYVLRRDPRRFLCFEKEYLKTDVYPQKVLQDAFVSEDIIYFLNEEPYDDESDEEKI